MAFFLKPWTRGNITILMPVEMRSLSVAGCARNTAQIKSQKQAISAIPAVKRHPRATGRVHFLVDMGVTWGGLALHDVVRRS